MPVLNSRRYPWSPLALTLLALWVRLHNLTYHSLWFDEVMSVHWARSELSRILEVSMNLVEDRLPPLYYLLLHGWRLLLGDGEVSVRLPSVLLGVLLVPVVYRLGADLFGRRVAVLAAALTALNPFLVWYSQEARMYALAVLLVSLGTWFFARAAIASSRQRVAWHYWLGYGLCAIAGLYTHLYTGLVLPAHALYLVLTWRRSRRAWVPFVVTMLVVGGIFAPLALAALRVSGEAGAGQPLASMGDRLWRLLSAFTVWKAPVPLALRVGINVVTVMLALAGLVLGARPCGKGGVRPGGLPRPMLLVALLLVVPLVMATLLLLRNQLAFFGERYFIVIVPWLLMAVAVRAYSPGYLSDRVPDAAVPTRVAFEGGLQLVGYWVPESQLLATDDLFHPPSGWVHVTLYWQTASPPAQDYTPFVHLVDSRGQVWGASLERPNDAFDFYPPTRWQAGQVMRADFDVNLNPETPPGEYTLVLGLRDEAGQQTMLADGSPQAPLTTVEIVR